MRMHFGALFDTSPEGRFTPKVPVRIGPMQLPAGSSQLPLSLKVGHVAFSELVGKYLEVDVVKGVHVVKGAS